MQDSLTVLPYTELGSRLQKLDKDIKVGIDSLSCSHLAYESLAGPENVDTVKEISGKHALVSKLKIIKNDTEVEGLRGSLARESASLISFYA